MREERPSCTATALALALSFSGRTNGQGLEVRLVFDRLPPPELRLNSRAVAFLRREAARNLRILTMKATNTWRYERGWRNEGLPFQDAEAWVTFIVPDRRKRDSDNFMAGLKPVWDELHRSLSPVIAGDDAHHLTVYPPTFEVRKGQEGMEIVLREKGNKVGDERRDDD